LSTNLPHGITPLDRLIQRLRIRRAARRIPNGARVLDVGTFDGSLFDYLGSRIAVGVGIDPNPSRVGTFGPVTLRKGSFPGDEIEGEFDCVTMLAVIEHIPREGLPEVADACVRALVPGGRVVITLPSPLVDRILDWLGRVRLVRGIELEQHYGLRSSEVIDVFSRVLRLVEHRRFQLRLNNLLVFER
jgi:2-polyprenyl-3-methyl-5-hydroxy-6-metoxy-1,4-benzoquinol methylase